MQTEGGSRVSGQDVPQVLQMWIGIELPKRLPLAEQRHQSNALR